MAAHRDLLGPEPHFRLDNPEWPILCGSAAGSVPHGRVFDSIVGLNSVVAGATVRHSVLEPGVVLEPGARVDDCVVMEDATIRRGARLRHAVVGTGAVIAPRARIGYDRDADRACFSVTPAGTVVIAPAVAGEKTAEPSAFLRV